MSQKEIEDCIWSLYQRNWPIDLAEAECIMAFPPMVPINGTTLSTGQSVSPTSMLSIGSLVGPTLASPTSVSPSVSTTLTDIGEIDNCVWVLYQRNWPINLAERECALAFPVTTKPINGTTLLPDSTMVIVSSDSPTLASIVEREAAIPNVWIW